MAGILADELSITPLRVPSRYESGPSSVLSSAAHDPFSHGFFGVYWLKTYWFPNLQLCQWSVGLVVNKFGWLSLTFNVVIDYLSHTYIHTCILPWIFWGLLAEDVLVSQFAALSMVCRSCSK